MNENKEREAFEEHVKTMEGYPFAGAFLNLMWKAWQARASSSRAPGVAIPDGTCEWLRDELQSLYDTEFITEEDSGDALIRLSDAMGLVDEILQGATPSPTSSSRAGVEIPEGSEPTCKNGQDCSAAQHCVYGCEDEAAERDARDAERYRVFRDIPSFALTMGHWSTPEIIDALCDKVLAAAEAPNGEKRDA